MSDWNKEYTVTLTGYELANLVELMRAITTYASDGPLSALHNGDWNMQVRWKFESAFSGDDPNKPNASADQMNENVLRRAKFIIENKKESE